MTESRTASLSGTARDAPTIAPAPGRAPRRRLGIRALVGGIVVALVVGAVAFGPALLVDLAPVSATFDEDAPAVAVDRFNGPEGTYVVGYDHDQRMVVTVELVNEGPVGMQVRDVRLAAQASPLLVGDGDVEPVVLAPGERARVRVPLRFDNCEAYHEREAMIVEQVAVTARVLGRDVTEAVALDRPLMARSPMLWQCPDRTIDRSDDLRMGSVR